jgi:hypothetical protein
MRNQLKKLTSTFLLFVLLFNSGGQLVVHHVLAYQSDHYFNKQTSRGLYYAGDLTVIAIPVSLPNVADQTEFIKTFGEIKFAHTAYNYVGIKITRTAIYLQCIPNYETTRLCGQNIIHAEAIKDFPVQKKQHVPHAKPGTVACSRFQFYSFEFTIPVKNMLSQQREPNGRQSDRDIEIPQPPPKTVS